MLIKLTSGKLKYVALTLMVLLAVVFLAIAVANPGSTLAFNSEPAVDFSQDWQVMDDSGKIVEAEEPLQLPAKLETNDAVVCITKIVPQGLQMPAVLSFRTAHQRVRLYCEDQLLYSFGYSEQPVFGKSPGSAWNIVRLPQDCQGKRLVMELNSPYQSYQGRIDTIQVGTKASLIFFLLNQYTFSFLMTSVIFVVGLVNLLVYFLIIRKGAVVGKETLYLGLFAMFVAVWLFGECRLTQFFAIPPSVNTCVTFMAMLATPIPLISYIACGCSESKRGILRVNSRLLCLLFVCSILLQAFGVLDFIEQLVFIHVCLCISCAVMMYAVISDVISQPNAQQRQLLISLGVLATFFILETIRLYTGGGNIGGLMRMGVLAFIAIQAYRAFKNAAEIVHMSQLAGVDVLTGCLNRTSYSETMNAMEGKRRVGVIIADINDLKQINDTFGHNAGDDAIVRCGVCFSEIFSPYGKCFRIGGDEFAMLGENLTADQMKAQIEALEQRCEKESLETEYPFVVSCGYAVYDSRQDRSLQDTVRRADKRMYANKHYLKHNCGIQQE